jgi:PDZ domain-containing protein
MDGIVPRGGAGHGRLVVATFDRGPVRGRLHAVPDALAPAPRVSRLWWFAAPVLALIVGVLVVVGAMPAPYVAFSPGRAQAVEPLIEVSAIEGGPEVEVDEATENLLYTTVSTRMEPSGIEVLLGVLDDEVQVEPSAPFLGTQTSDENRKLNLALMTDSQDKARKVALERLGFDVVSTPVGAFLEDVNPDYPAAEVLAPGMTVVEAGGEPVETRDDLVAAIAARQPGDVLDLAVVPLGQRQPIEVEAELGERWDEPGTAALGVTPVDRATFEFPVDIEIDTGQVGGPSAGLAFTLAILDRLTPGPLTGEEQVGVTGTIELDGRVGPVGGVRHKIGAALREGATVFLAPPDEYEEAVEAADGRLEVRSVATLDEALAALEDLGGEPLPEA